MAWSIRKSQIIVLVMSHRIVWSDHCIGHVTPSRVTDGEAWVGASGRVRSLYWSCHIVLCSQTIVLVMSHRLASLTVRNGLEHLTTEKLRGNGTQAAGERI